MKSSTRNIIHIDESKCDGCGLCATACAEGAIAIVNGKAKLVSETYCDGLGACLGECPRDAISMEKRPAAAFDEKAVEKHLHEKASSKKEQPCGCPGAAAFSFTPKHDTKSAEISQTSELSHWPVQLALVPITAAYWENADLLIAADCAAFAFGDFHQTLLRGRKLIIACPKLDDLSPFLEKLSAIIANNSIKSVTIVKMEVPCCGGLERFASEAIAMSGKKLPMETKTITLRGEIA
jgi:Pyruvate/2-oxoacid:ferredoxin oxidoreductase delta subunit